MQNTNRVQAVSLTTGEVVLGGVPVVIWGLADASEETAQLSDTDGDGNPGSTVVVTHTFTATDPVVSFPYGIEMKVGASIAAGDVTVFYTKI